MATLVTQDFEREIAEKTVNGGVIQYDEFIFAMIPNLNADNLAQHLTIPRESLIKHRQAVSKAGVINENAVVYSVTLGTEIGDFDFNWIGLINKRTNKLAAAVQADTIKKTRNKNNVQGNSLTRNVLLEFTGAKQLTGINVSADTWQIDFTVRLHGIDEKIRLTNRDLYGRAVFFDDAFLVKRGTGNNYTIDAGHAYVEGVRAEIKQAQTIQAASLPCSIYVDVVHHCTVTGAYETEIKFLKQSKSDYLDTARRQHYVQIIADIDSTGAVTDRRLLSPWFGITPKDLDDTTESARDKTGHTHKLPLASLIKKGLVKLYSGNDSDSEEMAATPKAVKTLKGFIDAITRSLNNYIPNSKKSSAVNSNSEDTIGTSKAVKIAYDRAVEAEKKGLPVGAIVAFHKSAKPHGYLKAIGGTFNQATYPDLYTANGNSNVLPNLNRSDVGMTAYFAFDEIPDGWIAFDSIRSTVTQQNYPELYKYLIDKYGAISNVPLAEDRFIRSSGNSLNVGQTQEDAIRNIKGEIDLTPLTSGNQFLEFESSRNHEIFKGAILPNEARWVYWSADQGHGAEMPRGFKFDASAVVPTADENRPKSIVLKLCIKAKNKFDDIQFWIKAFGVIENAGILDVGNLAQDLQQIRTKTQQLEKLLNQNREQTSFKLQEVEEKINSTKKESTIIWSGNVTQSQTNVIQLKDSVLNKKLTLYLQPSTNHSLNNNDNVHMTSVYVDKYSLEVAGKKYIHGAMYAGGWRNVQLELVEENKIKIIDISGFFLKQITTI
ncbi:phage tail protein [Pasteurella multocida]|uniref:phage tail-collar fiber domain-containing protein n=1 Tax=Pasteurella multocida TaxID=747 RepID=UPI002341221E|nr:phage tail protein [Pasteurella multocida]MDC4237650.1 phage tail protein [Pasteurella multocida]